jgi:hypothetical protein
LPDTSHTGDRITVAPLEPDEALEEGDIVYVPARVLRHIEGDLPDVQPGVQCRFDVHFHPFGAHYHIVPLKSVRRERRAA